MSAPTPVDDGLRRIWSCATCRRRKVKCDRREPCDRCVRNNIECHFPVTGRIPRYARDPITGAASPSQRQQALFERLRRLEDLVTELSGQLEDGDPVAGAQLLPGTGSSGSLASALAPVDQPPLRDARDMYEDFGKLVVDQGSGPRLDKGFWSIFCDEVNHIFQAIEAGEAEPEPPRQDPRLDGGPSTNPLHGQGYIFSTSFAPLTSPWTPVTEEDLLHPLPSQVPFLWRTYLSNVDPFIKVLHGPTVDALITQAKGRFGYHGPNVHALLSAICLAAIASLDADDVMDGFRVSKTDLVTSLRLRTERALGHVQFATTKDVVVAQALTIYLFILPHIGAGQLALNLAGMLVRIATSMGLHRDPLLAAKSPLPNPTDLDVETRRRLWWHILFLDSRGRDLSTPGGGITSEDLFSTQPPTNVDDQSLTGAPAPPPSTPQQDQDHQRLTPTTLSIIRCELWRLRSALLRNRAQPLDLQLQMVSTARSTIERRYLAPPQTPASDPAFTSFLAAITTLSFAKLEASLYYNSRQQQQQQQHPPLNNDDQAARAFAASVAVLQTTHDLCAPDRNPAWGPWRWQLQGRFPWRAVGDVFVRLCRLPWTGASEQAWELARGLLERHRLPDDEARGEALWRRLSALAGEVGVHRRREMEGMMMPVGGEVVGGVSNRRGEGGGKGMVVDEGQAAPPVGEGLLLPEKGAEVTAPAWEREVYGVEEMLGGWLDWEDVVDMDMFLTES